jgi:hypothetical protein
VTAPAKRQRPDPLSPTLTHADFDAGDHRNTSPSIVAVVHRFAPISLDPCSNSTSVVHALRSYDLSRGENGLLLPWSVKGAPARSVVLCNGTWSDLLPWATKARDEWLEHGVESIFVSRPESATAWAKVIHASASRIVAMGVRQSFVGADSEHNGNDKAASQLAYFGERVNRLRDVMEAAGHFVWRRA